MKYKVTHRHHERPAPAGQLAPPAGGRRGRHDGGRGHLAPGGRQDQVKYFSSDELGSSNYNNIIWNRFQSSGGQALYTATGAAQAQVVRYSRIWSTLSQIVMQEGARGLFKGLGPTLLGE